MFPQQPHEAWPGGPRIPVVMAAYGQTAPPTQPHAPPNCLWCNNLRAPSAGAMCTPCLDSAIERVMRHARTVAAAAVSRVPLDYEYVRYVKKLFGNRHDVLLSGWELNRSAGASDSGIMSRSWTDHWVLAADGQMYVIAGTECRNDYSQGASRWNPG